MPTPSGPMRLLTEKEHIYISRLLWRGSMETLAYMVGGITRSGISRMLHPTNPGRGPVAVIDRLMALQLDDIKVKKLTRAENARQCRANGIRSGL